VSREPSQQEIDAIFRNLPERKPDDAPSTFDLRRPDRIARSQLRATVDGTDVQVLRKMMALEISLKGVIGIVGGSSNRSPVRLDNQGITTKIIQMPIRILPSFSLLKISHRPYELVTNRINYRVDSASVRVRLMYELQLLCCKIGSAIFLKRSLCSY
jgi:hypothetical protein